MHSIAGEIDGRRRRWITLVANKLVRRRKSGLAAILCRHQQMTAFHPERFHIFPGVGERGGRIKEVARPIDDFLPTNRIEAFTLFCTIRFRNRIGSVKGIIKRTPARIGSIQCIARIHDWHDQLRTGNGCNFRINIGCFD